MNRYEILKDIFYQNIEDKVHGMHKKEGYFHSLQVSALCKQQAIIRNLDSELAGIIGLFHDYSTYINQTSFDHAIRSSQMTHNILIQTKLFTDDEMNIIVDAIKNHSSKDKIHDEYSELIKDVDVFIQYIDDRDAVLSQEYEERRKRIYTQ